MTNKISFDVIRALRVDDENEVPWIHHIHLVHVLVSAVPLLLVRLDLAKVVSFFTIIMLILAYMCFII